MQLTPTRFAVGIKDRVCALREVGALAGGLAGLSPTRHGRAQLGGAVHEIGEKGKLSLDVAFVPAAIDQDHRAGFPCLREGDGGRGVADALAPGDDEEGFEAGEGPGACGEGGFDPEGVQDVGGVGVGKGELEVVEFGQVGEELAIGLEGVEGDGIGGLRRLGAARRRRREGGREPFGPPPRWGRQPPKAPIWEAAAFFSTAASAGAS